jgi:hypothetical protein
LTRILGLLIALAVVPALLLGFLISPWFFIVLLLLPILAAVPLGMRERESGAGTTGGSGRAGTALIALGVGIPLILFGIPALVLGILYTPYFLLIVLFVVLPLLGVAFLIDD